MYTLSAILFGGWLNIARLFVIGAIGRMNGWTRYHRNTYMEVDISDLPPGEVLQIVWNGSPVFVRRLTQREIHQEEHEYPE